MNHLRRTKTLKQVSVQPPLDEEGYFGRECPKCEVYFKVKLGTGLPGNNLCYCAYCGHSESHNHFATPDQIKYVTDIALNKVRAALNDDLRDFARSMNRKGFVEVKFTSESSSPVYRYQEKDVETKLTCERCTLDYAVYGAFAFCPDCGTHNSLLILHKNLELAEKILDVAGTEEGDLTRHLVGNALQNAVASFDGFGREACRVSAHKASDINKAKSISFQNIRVARQRVQEVFGFDIASCVDSDEWEFVCQCFQKRHLLAHSMGIVDEEYLKKTNDSLAVKGRKIPLEADEVNSLLIHLKVIGAFLSKELEARPPVP